MALKLNASDYVKGGLTEEDALEQVRVIAGLKTSDGRTCVDMIEVSGGDYETPGEDLFRARLLMNRCERVAKADHNFKQC